MPFDPLSEDDSWPDEPDEFDPERDLPNVPAAPGPKTVEADVDPDVQQTFWLSVVLANVAVAGFSLGPMLIYFRGMWVAGAASIAVGALALLRTYQHYQAFKERRIDGETADEETGDDARDDTERNG